jgi:hypothetical protein
MMTKPIHSSWFVITLLACLSFRLSIIKNKLKGYYIEEDGGI